VGLGAEQLDLGLEAVDREYRGNGVGHLDDGRDAARGRRGGPRSDALFLGVPWFPEVDVPVHEAGQHDFLI